MAGLDANGPFHGREATVDMAPAIDDIENVTDFGAQSLKDTFDSETTDSVGFSGVLTEITITDPEAAVEVQNTFGGQVMSESPHDLVEFDFTARFEDLEFMEQLHGSTTDVGSTDFKRISGGTTIGDRPQKVILFRLVKGSNEINYLANNAIFAQMGEISLAGDGAAEITGTAYCRIADRYVEKNF